MSIVEKTTFPRASSQIALQTAETTGSGGIFGRIWGAATSAFSGIAHLATDPILASIKNRLEKETRLGDARAVMRAAVHDPQFLEGADFVCALLGDRAEKKIEEMADGFQKRELIRNRALIRDVIDVNVMRGLANLAKEVAESRCDIPNYDSQSALVNLLSLFAQKFQAHVSIEALNALSDLPETERQKELEALALPLVNELILMMFPGGFSDVVLPYVSGIVGLEFVQSYLFRSLKETFADFILESYNSMQEALQHRQSWEEKIHARAPNVDIATLIQAPAEYLVKAVQHYIQAHPNAVVLIEEGISSLVQPKEKALSQIAYADLSGWILQSLQSLLRTEDPHLRAAGQCLSQLFGNIALSLMAKGIDFSMPAQEQIAEDQYLNFLVQQFINRVNAIRQGEKISDDVWRELVEELPLPACIKPFLLAQLLTKAKSAQEALRERGTYTEEIENYYSKAMEEVSQLEGCNQLIKISEGVTNLIIQKVVAQTIELTHGSEKYEELLDEYFPGIVLSEEFKGFLRNNIYALTGNGQEAPEAMELLRKGIQAAVLNSIVLAVQKKNDPGCNYAAQLSQQIQQAFNYAFQHFSEDEKLDLFYAMALQKEADELEKKIEELQGRIPKKLDDVFVAKKRLIRNSHQIQMLCLRQQEFLRKCGGWNPEKLQLLQEACAFRKIHQADFEKIRLQKNLATEEEALRYRREKILRALGEPMLAQEAEHLRESLAHVEMLLEVVSMGETDLKWIRAALQIGQTIVQAKESTNVTRQNMKRSSAGLGDLVLKAFSRHYKISTLT